MHPVHLKDIVPAMFSVLYVDDEPDLLELTRLFLESSQEFAVSTSDSAEKALQVLEHQRFDAIISDFQMPGMNGIMFLKEVRSAYGEIPFIIFTGRGREEVVIEALNNGADFYLQKGGEPNALYAELMHVIRQTIQMRQAKTTLAEQEQRYHDIQNANDLIQSVAPDGHFLFVNKKWLDTLGYREEDLADLTLFDIIHEESREHCRNLFPRILTGENVGIIDTAFRTRTGEKVYVEGWVTCKMADGKPQYTRGIFKDVTDRKRAEAALRESEARYRALYNDNPIMLFTLDPGGNVISVNKAGADRLGYTAGEIEGQSVLKVFFPDDRAAVTEHNSRSASGLPGKGSTGSSGRSGKTGA
jgi:PAS domain S-box-containing protein